MLGQQGLGSVLNRTQPFQLQPDAFVVVVTDVLPDSGLQLFDTVELVEVEKLRLEGTKDALHGGIVQAVAFV